MLIDLCTAGGVDICRNGGTCTVDDKGKVGCICRKEYSGTYCEKGMNILL